MFKKPEQETAAEAPNETEYIAPENPEPCQLTKDDSLTLLESLIKEEQTLLDEKAQLINMEIELRQKIALEIEDKKHRIEDLKHEIPKLRQTCEALAKALNTPANQ